MIRFMMIMTLMMIVMVMELDCGRSSESDKVMNAPFIMFIQAPPIGVRPTVSPLQLVKSNPLGFELGIEVQRLRGIWQKGEKRDEQVGASSCSSNALVGCRLVEELD